MQKLTSRRFLITILAMAFNIVPLFYPSQEARWAMVSVTIISVISIGGLNIEDWLFARQTLKGVPVVGDVLDIIKPLVTPPDKPTPTIPGAPSTLLLAGLALYLIMRIGL